MRTSASSRLRNSPQVRCCAQISEHIPAPSTPSSWACHKTAGHSLASLYWIPFPFHLVISYPHQHLQNTGGNTGFIPFPSYSWSSSLFLPSSDCTSNTPPSLSPPPLLPRMKRSKPCPSVGLFHEPEEGAANSSLLPGKPSIRHHTYPSTSAMNSSVRLRTLLASALFLLLFPPRPFFLPIQMQLAQL